MRVTFVSNYFSHHQRPLSDALDELTQGEFRFIATQRAPQERSSLGWEVLDLPEYVSEGLDGHLSTDDIKWLLSSDVLLFGSAPEHLLKSFLAMDGLAFRYSERPLKTGDALFKRVPRWVRWHMRNPEGKRLYLLSAGAYAATDYAKYGLFRRRAYKWGYFPPFEVHTDVGELIASKRPSSILWCGRFLEWKHPDLAIQAAVDLKAAGYDFMLDLVGEGPMESELRKAVESQSLQSNVHVLSPCANAAMRQLMNQTQVFLFTSDYQEGWGAVLNEAMNGACAVVASEMAGSTPYLLQDGVNGFTCEELRAESYTTRIAQLLDKERTRDRLATEAYRTVAEAWNARIAAQRLLELSTAILDGDESPELFKDGPCSKAE